MKVKVPTKSKPSVPNPPAPKEQTKSPPSRPVPQTSSGPISPRGVTVNRDDFVHLLESVQAGLSPREIVEQSSCVAFLDGRVLTYNEEIACSAPSGLPKEYRGAVQAKPLLDQLRKWPDETVAISFANGFKVTAGSRQMELNMEREVLLPLDGVEKPDAGKWQPLNDDFTDAVGIVESCAGKDESNAALTCIHLTDKYMEACDNFQLTRYKLKTGVTECCVKRDSLKVVPALDMREISETPGWLHFRSNSGLQVSVRKHAEEYMDLSPFLVVEGEKTVLPKALAEAVERAEILSAENADQNLVKVDLQPGKVKVRGEGASGWFQEAKKVKYSGQPIRFMVAPKLLIELVKRHTDCIVSMNHRLKVEGSRWTYVACLEPATDAKKEE